MGSLQTILVLLLFVLLIIPMGKYVYKVFDFQKTKGDRFFDKIDNFIYKVCGIERDKKMNWKEYTLSIITISAIMTLVSYILLRIQAFLPLNPSGAKGMEQSLSFNTVISFLTNTNLQDYSGESALSHLSQMIVIIFFMFASAAIGYSTAVAFIRGLRGDKDFGNFFVDMTRTITRILLPLSIVVTILLVAGGVPQTFSGTKTVTTIEGKMQDIARGPVAALESIKHIGTNGGGFFGANSAHPFENPNPITNIIEMLAMMLLPGSLVVAFGHFIKSKKQGWAIFAAMAVLLLVMIPICHHFEAQGNPALSHYAHLSQSMGNMEGKEERFGVSGSSLFTVITTSFTTGSVNNAHDSLTPMGGMVALLDMMFNVIFGGKGVGFMNMITYVILTVFICGLMIGRTPEFLKKKIEGKEVKLVAVIIIFDAILVLVPTAIALITKSGFGSITNPKYHGLSQVLYQYATSKANNGSGFEGLTDNTIFWNTTTGIVMFLGRYISIIALMAVAGSLAKKQEIPNTSGTFRTDNALFVVNLIAIVIVIGALTFLPALALGPISEHLTLQQFKIW